jgi:hypothetical protein
MNTDTSICNLRLSKFAEGLIPEEKNMYCAKLKELWCVDPLLRVWKIKKTTGISILRKII